MKRYFRLVKELDEGKITKREFVREIFGSSDWSDYQAGYWIYKEDGGKMSFEEWFEGVPRGPIPFVRDRYL